MKCRSCPYDYGGEQGLEEYYAQGVRNIEASGLNSVTVRYFYLSSSPSTVMRFYAAVNPFVVICFCYI